MTAEELKKEETLKTNRSYNTIETKTIGWKMMLANSIGSSEILEILKKRNMTEEKIMKIKERCENVLDLNKKQSREYGEKLNAYEEYRKLREELRENYYETRTLGKLLFEEDESIKAALGLKESTKRTFEVFIEQVMTLADNTLKNETAIAKFAEVGITRENIEALKADADMVMQAKTAAENEASESTMSTKERNEEFEKLEKEMRLFITVAKFALKNEPLLSKKLGV